MSNAVKYKNTLLNNNILQFREPIQIPIHFFGANAQFNGSHIYVFFTFGFRFSHILRL